MTGVPWSAVLAAGGIALFAPFILRPVLRRLGVFDVPNHRSSHKKPILRAGGVAPLIGIAVGGAWLGLEASGTAAQSVAAVTMAAVAIGLVGLVEDIKGLRILARAGLQFLIGGALFAYLAFNVGASLLWLPLAALFFAANVNFTNFMDGVNGISGMHGAVVGISFAVMGGLSGLTWLVGLGLIVAISFAAFLPWNLVPPGMFLGDVGSYLLGGVVGAIAIAALAAGLNPLGVLSPLGVYWADAVSTLALRAARGERLFEAHRSHTYQRLASIFHDGPVWGWSAPVASRLF